MIRGIQTTVTPQVRSSCPSSAPQEPELRFPSRVHSLPPSSVRALHTATQRIRSVVNSRLYAAAHLGAGALGLDVAGLLALVADLLAGGGTLGAVTGEVAVLAAVVALGAVDAVT